MGLAHWWDETVVPRVIKCCCGQPPVMEIRTEVVPQAHGAVFELGCGGGINQTLYDTAQVSSYTGIDPSAKGLEYAREAAMKKGWQAEIVQACGEAIPFGDDRFDTVVCTFTLCSVHDHARTLSELRRIVKPGGVLLFAEHGRSPDARVARMQQRLDPVWRKLAGNCHLSRPIGSAIVQAGFALEPVGARYMDTGPRFVSWMEWGRAVKAG